MANRRRRPAESGGLVTFCVVGGLIYGLSWLSQRMPAGSAKTGEQVALTIIGSLALLCLLPILSRFLARNSLSRKTRAVIQQHIASLVRRKAQLAQRDAYGRLQTEKWNKELVYFIEHQIEPELSGNEQRSLARNFTSIMDTIDKCVDEEMLSQPTAKAFHDEMTPFEFEAFCADALCEAGWDARTTMHSRDQGVDVIAEKNRIRVVLQCKLYSRPVGNKSVQEAAAAKMHERAHYAVVVTNNRYTTSADELAVSGARSTLLTSNYGHVDRSGVQWPLRTVAQPRTRTNSRQTALML